MRRRDSRVISGVRRSSRICRGALWALALAAVFSLAGPSAVMAVQYDVFWDGGGGDTDFANPANWNDPMELVDYVPYNNNPNPGNTHNGQIGNNGAATVDLNAPLPDAVDWIGVSGNGGTDSNFNINANLALTNRLVAGNWLIGGGIGRINVNSGTTTTPLLQVGGTDPGSEGAEGELNIAPGATLQLTNGAGDATAWIGQRGVGTVNVAGGGTLLNTNGGGSHVRIGTDGGSGTINVDAGGTVDVNRDLFLGLSGGTGLIVNNGGNVVSQTGWAYVGYNSGSTGIVANNSGTFSAGGGDIRLGEEPNSNGTLLVNGGTVNAPRVMHVGVTGNGTGIQTDGVVNVGTQFNVAWGGSGVGFYQQDGGTLNVGTSADVNADRRALIAYGDTSVGVYNMNGGALHGSSGMVVGGESGSSQGFFNQTGGDVVLDGNGNDDQGWLHVGHNGGGGVPKSEYNMSGGTLTVGAANPNGSVLGIARGGNGAFNLSGGTATVNGWVLVGDGGTSHGELNVSGGTLNVNATAGNAGEINIASWDATDATMTISGTGQVNAAGTVNVGLNLAPAAALGVVIQSGGQLNAPTISLGTIAGGTGVYTMSDGTITGNGGAGADQLVGNGGVGNFTQSGGTNNAARVIVGNQATAVGNYNMTGGALNTSGGLTIGEVGLGTFTLDDGAVTIGGAGADDSGWLHVGHNGGGVGTLNINGGSIVGNSTMGLARGATSGVVNQTGGTLQINNNLIAGDGLGTHAEYNISGGSATFTGEAAFGSWNAIDSTLRVSGTGQFNVGTNLYVGRGSWEETGVPLNANGVAEQSGGEVNVGGTTILGDSFDGGSGAPSMGIYTHAGGTLNSTNIVVGNKGLGTFVQDGGDVNLGPGGTLTIAAAARGAGSYTLLRGTLDGNGGTLTYGAGLGTFTMEGGRIQDVATINFTLEQDGGTLAPGNSPGHTTINNSYEMDDDATLEIELDGVGAGTLHDLLTVNNGVQLDGDLDVILGFDPAIGDSFLILENLDDLGSPDPIVGSFAGLLEGATFVESFGANSYTFRITYQGLTGNDVMLTVVPEPSSLVLGGFAVAGLALAFRRARRKAPRE